MSSLPRVCIIDDEPDIREIYQKKFSMEGFDVVVAANGAEGLEAIDSFKPDVILLDLQMPVKSGIDVLNELSTTGKLEQVPIVLLTNINSEEILQQTVQFNVRLHLLIKSMITPQVAVDYVRKLLDGKPIE